MIHHELRIKKATHLIQRTHPWIDREDVFSIVLETEKGMKEELKNDFEPMNSQDIIDLVCSVVRDI